MSNQFTHLHLHTQYSLRDAITEPEALMKKCSDYGMKAVAVTDHGNLMGAWECAKYAKKYGVKYIPGNEVYVVPDTKTCRGADWGRGKSGHLVLVAYNQRGWENLLTLTTRSNLEGFYNEPRIDYKMLRQHKDGLFVHSACLGGVTAKAYFAGQSIHLVAEMYKEIFGDKFSLEIQLNNRPEQLLYNDALIKVAKDTGIPLITTVDSHYLDKADSHKQDLIFCLGMDKLLNDPNRHRYPPEAHSVETPDEVYSKFVKQYGEIGRLAIARTTQISDACEAIVETETKNYKIPSVSIADAEDYQEYIQWKKNLIEESNVKAK